MPYEMMSTVLDRCEIMLYDCVISNEELMKHYWTYLASSVGVRKHNIGMTLHTGSDCFAAMSIAFAALFCYAENTLSPSDIVESLSEGDRVL